MLLLAFVAVLKKIRNDFEKLKLTVLQAFVSAFITCLLPTLAGQNKMMTPQSRPELVSGTPPDPGGSAQPQTEPASLG